MKRFKILFSFLIPLLLAFPVYADSGGISGTYEYDGERISSVEVNLYKIADYDGANFVFREGFGEAAINRMTNSELGEYAQELATIVQDPEVTTYTSNGEYNFANIDEGIYLVTYKNIKIGDYTYSALPIVLTMPDAAENYQISLTTKIEKNCPDCEPEPEPGPTPSKDEKNSNTQDKINFYIKVFLALILFETLTLFVILKERKREDSNENK